MLSYYFITNSVMNSDFAKADKQKLTLGYRIIFK